ncbi:MAG: hypothetical protein ABIO94_11085 [Opitutaceae bacterium]
MASIPPQATSIFLSPSIAMGVFYVCVSGIGLAQFGLGSVPGVIVTADIGLVSPRFDSVLLSVLNRIVENHVDLARAEGF